MRTPDDREFVERFAEVTAGRRPTGLVEPVLAAELWDTYGIHVDVRTT
ncbi:hypothetical protein ABZ356_03845 [Micromonospora zamorensis]